MRIPAKSDYALRAVVAIARQPIPATCKAEALARSPKAIPFEYLQNILRDLRRAGLLRAQRGYEGGFQLEPARGMRSRVSDVLEAVASPLTEPYRDRVAVWDALETSTRDLLGSTTVADFVARADVGNPRN